jgi:hypothetical protein
MLAKQWWRVVGFVLAIALPAAAQLQTAPDDNTLWVDNFNTFETSDDPHAGWKVTDASSEIIEGRLRLRETGEKSHSVVYRYVGFDRREPNRWRYIQLRLGQIEHAEQGLSVSNVSSNGKPFGPAFTGVNTYDFSAQPYDGRGMFALRFTHLGVAGTEPGGWLDIESVRYVDRPVGGLTIDLIEADDGDGIAQVGEAVLFAYYPDEPVTAEDDLTVRCFVADTMGTYRFAVEPAVLADDDGDGVWSARVTITEDAYLLADKQVMASVRIAGVQRHAYAAFGVDIQTNAPPPVSPFAAKTPLAREYRALWVERTQGRNLAFGLPVRFSTPGNYALTAKGDTDAADLTDGRLASRLDDRIWFAADAVGWQDVPVGVNMLIDLGEVRAIDRVVARFLGGGVFPSLKTPGRIAVLVSTDGETYYQAATLEKLMPAERLQADWQRTYFLSEDGDAFAYPFELAVRTKARYVALRFETSGFTFCDEVAVIAGDFDVASVSYDPASKVAFFMDGLLLCPPKPTLAISTNIATANILSAVDSRLEAVRDKPVVRVMELPAALDVTFVGKDAQTATSEAITHNGMPYRRWRVPGWPAGSRPQQWGPLYIMPKARIAIPDDATAVFYVECEGVEPNVVEVPIELIEIPRVPPLERLHVSVAWMGLGISAEHPGFFDAWQHMGFNALGTFPRYWKNQVSPANAALMDEARRRGMGIIYNESPFHVMVNSHRNEPEIYSQFVDGSASTNPCPSYRGQFYHDEIKRVGDCFELSDPNYVLYDIELWYPGAVEAKRCKRCSERQQASGRPMDEELIVMGTEMLRDMRDEIARRCESMGRQMPVIAMYDLHAETPVYHLVYDFRKVFGDCIDQAQPSLYVQGSAQRVHDSIRAEWRLLGSREILPWLSTGTYGEFEPYKLEYMILEALLNGARGITYYWWGDFDTPWDYYYHAKALAHIAPFEDLIMDGEPIELTGSNDALTYSAIRRGDELLILVGNYMNAPSVSTTIDLPFEAVASITDLRDGKRYGAGPSLELAIAPQKIVLLHVVAARR